MYLDYWEKGQKGGATKETNTSEKLVPVHTGLIDKVWSTKFAVATRTPSTKDTAKNFKEISNEFLTELNKVYNYASKKDYAKLLTMVGLEDRLDHIPSGKFIYIYIYSFLL